MADEKKSTKASKKKEPTVSKKPKSATKKGGTAGALKGKAPVKSKKTVEKKAPVKSKKAVEKKAPAKPKKAVKKKKTVTTKSVIKSLKGPAEKVRDIGISVPHPKRGCDDVNCPFHGSLSVRGQIIEGIVANTKMDKSAVVYKERLYFLKKYERYEKRTSRYSVHNPPCLGVKPGDRVKIAECRPLSKTISFVIIERRGPI